MTTKLILAIAILLSACHRTGMVEQQADAASAKADATAVEVDAEQLMPDVGVPSPDLAAEPDTIAAVDVEASVDTVATTDATVTDTQPATSACSVGWQETRAYSLPAGELFKNDTYCVPVPGVDAGAGVSPCTAGFVRTWYGASIVLCPPYSSATVDGGID